MPRMQHVPNPRMATCIHSPRTPVPAPPATPTPARRSNSRTGRLDVSDSTRACNNLGTCESRKLRTSQSQTEGVKFKRTSYLLSRFDRKLTQSSAREQIPPSWHSTYISIWIGSSKLTFKCIIWSRKSTSIDMYPLLTFQDFSWVHQNQNHTTHLNALMVFFLSWSLYYNTTSILTGSILHALKIRYVTSNKMQLQLSIFGKGQSKLNNKIYAYNSKKKRNIVK